MTCYEILEFIDSFSPFSSQEDWDNSGLQIANKDECERLFTSLEISLELAQNVEPNSAIITHHPLFFRGIKKIDNDYTSQIIRELITKNCALISVHTNFDKSHLNRYFIEQILGKKVQFANEFLAYFENDFDNIFDLADFVGEKIGVQNLQFCPANSFAKDLIAVCTGSGMSLVNELKCDVFLTGDIKYHEALDAVNRGINLVDIRHFESERYFADAMAKCLEKLPIKTIISPCKNPFYSIKDRK